MQASFRRNLSSLARRGGLHAPLRAVYNFLFLSRSTRGLTIGPLRAEFKTPTHTIAEHVESWGGERVLLGGLLEELRGDDVFWDIGASFGLYTVFAAKKLASPGSVVAFEPEPDMRELLEKNLVLNGIRSVNVRATALGDRDGVTGLFRAANPNSGTSSLAQRRDYRLKKKEIAVELSRGDSLPLREGVLPPTCVKIDVEGAEGRVIAGMESLLRDRRLRSLFCEVHPHLLPSFGDRTDSFERTLTGFGFAVTERVRRGTEYHIVCRR